MLDVGLGPCTPSRSSSGQATGFSNDDVFTPGQESVLSGQTPCFVHVPGHLEYKLVSGRLVGSDFGSGANTDLTYYDAQPERVRSDWLMLGHGIRRQMVLLRESPLVRRVQSWTLCWSGHGSMRSKDYAIYIPTCDDPDFVACGVVFVFGRRPLAQPKPSVPVGLVHRSAVEQLAPGELEDLWADTGSRASDDVVLKSIPETGTAWPVVATMLDHVPPAHTVRLSKAWMATQEALSPEQRAKKLQPGALPLYIRNTFVDLESEVPLLETFFRRRAVSWAGPDGDLDTISHAGDTTPSEPPPDDDDRATDDPARVRPLVLPSCPSSPSSGSSCHQRPPQTRPCDVILLQLHFAEVCRLGIVCSSLRHWPRRFQQVLGAHLSALRVVGLGGTDAADLPQRADSSSQREAAPEDPEGAGEVGIGTAKSRKVFPFRPQGPFQRRRKKAARSAGC
mmetsp:Transcript_53872/g.108165  ORF Transcript_53872/g.108165 Transcript_53872/m.108165 type:complete len:450 (-) Transcript_53872:231-1580(-)